MPKLAGGPGWASTAIPRVVDLFCGAGGFSEGFRQAGFRVLGGSDIDPDAMATYALNFPEAEAIPGDVRSAPVHEAVTELARQADVIVGGPPCQAFSQVRNHTRIIDDPRNALYREFVSIVADAKPQAFVMENVPGMAQMGVKEQVAQDLSLAGEYRVQARLVDAADFGVPQTRKRLLFIGVRRDLGIDAPSLGESGATTEIQLIREPGPPPVYSVSAAEGLFGSLAASLADPFDLTATTAAQAIGDLIGLHAGRREDTLVGGLGSPQSAYQKLMRDGLPEDAPLQNVSVPRTRTDTVLRLRAIPPGGNHRDLPPDLLDRYLTGEKWGPHNGSGQISRRHYYAYRRLHPDIWAWTLNTKADSVYHYAGERCLSVREFARLQSFPDRFVFVTDSRPGPLPGRIDGGAAHSRYRQAGNAVPPLLAAALAREILATLKASSLETVAHGRGSGDQRRRAGRQQGVRRGESRSPSN